jgi:ABC-type transport system involved in cytochrome bd biosynthesis fused ATPase/permease subunit
MQPRTVFSYYGAALGPVLRRPARIARFVAAVALHAAGHALVALVAGGVAISLAGGVAPRGSLPSTVWGAGSPSDRALALALAGLAAIAMKAVAGVYATYVQAHLGGEVGAALRLELLDALLTVHPLRRPRQADHGVQVAPTAQGVAALTERVREVEAGLATGMLGGARAIAQLVPLAALLIALSPRMALAAAAAQASFGWMLGRVRTGYRAALRRAAADRDKLLEAADESVRHAELWATYGAEWKARGGLRALGERIAEGSAKIDARVAALSGANEVLGACALLIAVVACRAGWLGGTAEGSTLLAFAVTFFLAYRPVRELADARLAAARAQVAYEDVCAVSAGAEVEVGAGSAARSWPLADLEVRDLRIARGASAPLSFRVGAGAIAVVIGPTGVGKTTLLRTLLGLDRSLGGEVSYDGESLGDAPVGPAARPFVWGPQDSPLLADSLEANVGLGGGGTGAREILEALGAGQLATEVGDGRLGAGGRAVSGGERQWIGLARAIASDQPVLLLDEPTSGLDARSEQAVLGAIQRLRGRRTVVVVTHRPEVVAIGDVVVRLGDQTERIDSVGPRVTRTVDAGSTSPSST